MSLSRQMLDAVGDLPCGDGHEDEFARGAFQILVAALAKLPQARQAELLADIESGWLREKVAEFIALYAARRQMN